MYYNSLPPSPSCPFGLHIHVHARVCVGPEITITCQPASIVCQPGDSVTFVCEATCSVRFSYCWYHNDTIMDPVEDQSSIGIYVDENTFGSYCCHITTNDGYHRKEKRSRVAQLVLGEPVESELVRMATYIYMYMYFYMYSSSTALGILIYIYFIMDKL